MPFTVLGGKFTRYFAIAEPLLLISAAVAFYFGVRWLTARLRLFAAPAAAFQIALLLALLAVPVYNSLGVGPHYRMFTNTVGGGMAAAGSYFPHDEFYDASSRDVVSAIAAMSPGSALIACEAPYLIDYYTDRVGMPALDTVSLSDPEAVGKLKEGDFVVVTSGRRYFSNDAYQRELAKYPPDSEVFLGQASAAKIYKLDSLKIAGIQSVIGR